MAPGATREKHRLTACSGRPTRRDGDVWSCIGVGVRFFSSGAVASREEMGVHEKNDRIWKIGMLECLLWD